MAVKEVKGKAATTPLTEGEKEKYRLLIPFDKAKEFVSNIHSLVSTDPIFSDWEIISKSTNLKGHTLKLNFGLKDTTIEKEIEALDPHQKTLDDKFEDPDEEEE